MVSGMEIVWTEYLEYRARTRGYDLKKIREILRYSSERYIDTVSGRFIAIGRHGKTLVMIPYEVKEDSMVPVTIHAISRQQIRFRIKTGRFKHE